MTVPVLPYSTVPGAARPGQFQPANTGYGSAYAASATEWTVGTTSIGLSQLATEYVLIPVAATKAGVPYNPTGDIVQFAFMPQATQVPGNSDWVTGSWDTDTASVIYPYSAKCLVGPSGAITLGIGTFVIYVKITDAPEVPVLIAGQLQIS